MSSPEPEPNYRTPLELVVKTIMTHAFAIATYTYASSLLHRPTRSRIQALRLLFFLFVPTLPLIEFLISSTRSVLQFLRNYEDDEDMHFKYYLSSALGMHAQVIQEDDSTERKDANGKKDRHKNVHLLDVGSHCAEPQVSSLSWLWAGKLLGALFTLTQAIGAIVIWARRLNAWEAAEFSFDHRNGSMGIASAICSTVCVLTLLLRLDWKVSKAFEAPSQKEVSGYMGYFSSQRNQFVVEALLAMLLHLGIASIPNSDNKWLYTSVGSVAFLLTGDGVILLQGWQTIMLVIFIYIFRHDISRRLGLSSERYQKYFGGRRLYKVKALFGFLLMVWVLIDIGWLFVVDVLQVVSEAKDRGRTYSGGFVGYWWQDPLSDSLIMP